MADGRRVAGPLQVSGSSAPSGLLNAALPRLAVESVPADRAAMGSGANNTARYIGSSAGVALTIAVAPAGVNTALWVSAGLAVPAAASVLLLRPRRTDAG